MPNHLSTVRGIPVSVYAIIQTLVNIERYQNTMEFEALSPQNSISATILASHLTSESGPHVTALTSLCSILFGVITGTMNTI